MPAPLESATGNGIDGPGRPSLQDSSAQDCAKLFPIILHKIVPWCYSLAHAGAQSSDDSADSRPTSTHARRGNGDHATGRRRRKASAARPRVWGSPQHHLQHPRPATATSKARKPRRPNRSFSRASRKCDSTDDEDRTCWLPDRSTRPGNPMSQQAETTELAVAHPTTALVQFD